MSNPTWSPDSKHLAFMAMYGNRWLVVVDGAPAKTTFTGFVKGVKPEFITPTKIQTLAVQDPGLEFVRYEINLP
jgi:hypothetical protein